MYKRVLNLEKSIQRKSLFLFGPRQTGKSFYLKKTFKNALYYDLLRTDLFFRLTSNPSLLREEVLADSENKLIIIDEIQKLPILLDEVHLLIEEYDRKFILTGSSARKLKYGASNLLGGRALTRHLYPLVSKEMGDYDIERIVNFGSIPSIYDSDEPLEDLEAYVGTYLKEEIQAEGAVRKLEQFARFLNLAAMTNSEILNYSSIGSDLGLPAKTIREYFRILEDTLVGTLLEPYIKTIKRKATSRAKFYFFDVGVANVLANRFNIKPQTELFGKVFEHFICLELHAYINYNKIRQPLTFWRSRSGYEVDFLVGDHIAIEVKSSTMVKEKHCRGLNVLSEELNLERKIIVSMDDNKRLLGEIEVIPYREFLAQLWNGQIF